MSQNLRSQLHQQQIPPEVLPMIASYNKAYESDVRGTLLGDNSAFDDTEDMDAETPITQRLTALPIEYHQLLKRWILDHDPSIPASGIHFHGLMRNKIRRFAQDFQTARTSPQDSHILYQRNPLKLCTGRIRDIFSHTRYRTDGSGVTDTFFVVDTYQTLSSTHALLDHYRLSPVVGGQIHYVKFVHDPVIITRSDVICHVALTECELPGVEELCVHSLPLDKVRDLVAEPLMFQVHSS